MRRILSSIILSISIVSLLPLTQSVASISCPDTWTIPKSSSEIRLLENDFELSTLAESTGISMEQVKKALDLGQKFLIFKESIPILPSIYYEKIKEGGRNISVVGQKKISTDGKNWRSSVGTNWDLLPLDAPFNIESEPRKTNAVRLFSVTSASRLGMIPGAKVAFEITVNVNGCKSKIFYENIATVPNYKIETKVFDSLLDDYYKIDPSYKQMNFVEQQSCNQSLNSFISHVKQISQTSTTWTIKNTNRGVLDLAWSLTGSENSTCYNAFPPFMDINLSPTFGDSCITLKNPGKSIFTYTTLKYPCSVSIDLNGRNEAGSFEMAKFVIVKPSLSASKSTAQTIICVKGKNTKKITSSKPKCPTGYKLSQSG